MGLTHNFYFKKKLSCNAGIERTFGVTGIPWTEEHKKKGHWVTENLRYISFPCVGIKLVWKTFNSQIKSKPQIVT